MHLPPANRDTRRGLVAVVDGLALCLLAVVLAAYMTMPASARTAENLLETISTVILNWLATPGVEAFEAVAYVGLAVAVLGPGWYWALKPFFTDEPMPDGGQRPKESDPFVYEGETYRGRSPAWDKSPDAVTRSLMPELEPIDWIADLLEGATERAGDFYRGGTASTDATTPEAAGPRPNLSSIEELEYELERDVMELETVYDAAAGELGGDTWTAPSTAAFVRAAAAGRAIDGATAEAVEAHRRERTDPVDRLADEIGTSRERLERVGNRLRLALGDRSAVRAGSAVSGIVNRAEETLEPLERHDPAPPVDLSAAIETMRADQRQIEAAFAAALRDDRPS